MKIARYEPWSILNQLQREMDNLIRREGDTTTSPVSDWTPAVDIRETDSAYILRVDVPGVNPQAIDINMENNVLTISGKRDTETTDEKNGYKRVERVTGTFHRRFTLPDSIDSDHITAKTDNGVLEITLPKQAKVMPRKIAVQAPAPAANNTISTTSTSAAA